MVGYRVDSNVGWPCIGSSVTGDEVRGLKEDICFVADDASQWRDALKDVVDGISDCIVHGCLVVAGAGKEVVTEGIKRSFTTWALLAHQLRWNDREPEFSLEHNLEEVIW